MFCVLSGEGADDTCEVSIVGETAVSTLLDLKDSSTLSVPVTGTVESSKGSAGMSSLIDASGSALTNEVELVSPKSTCSSIKRSSEKRKMREASAGVWLYRSS